MLIRKASGQQMTRNHSEYLKAWKGEAQVSWKQGQVRPGKERNAVEPSLQEGLSCSYHLSLLDLDSLY